MAAIVVTRTDNYYDPNSRTPLQTLMLALANQDTYAVAAQMKVLGRPQFVVYGTTDTNTAGSTAINLTTSGVTFPDATQRVLRAVAHVADNDGQGLITTTAVIDGGTTPIIADESIDQSLDDGLAGAPTISFDLSGNDVIVTAVGITDVDCRWVIDVFVEDLVSLAYIPTT